MDGIHDMGGMHGFGPIDREEDEPVFHAEWEGRVLAICRALRVPVPGGMRDNIERMDPAEYLRTSYYEKWLHARARGLVDAGVITRDELEEKTALYRRDPHAALPRPPEGPAPAFAETSPTAVWSGKTEDGVAPPPAFAVGDPVRAKTPHPRGHTRLPRYIRGKRGRVQRLYRPQALQDAEPVDGRDGPQTVYAVRFAAEEIWGADAEPGSSVVLDMWEAYLEKA